MGDWPELLWLVLIDSVTWGALHMGVAWGGTQLPAAWFSPRFPLFLPMGWEDHGRFYERVFRVRRWKRLLPDGSAWFRRGFRKGRLGASNSAYLEQFVRETCRGEAVHWVVMSCGWLFFAWNPPWLAWCMVAYALTANLPCIITQRYNRLRMTRVIRRGHPASGQ